MLRWLKAKRASRTYPALIDYSFVEFYLVELVIISIIFVSRNS